MFLPLFLAFASYMFLEGEDDSRWGKDQSIVSILIMKKKANLRANTLLQNDKKTKLNKNKDNKP